MKNINKLLDALRNATTEKRRNEIRELIQTVAYGQLVITKGNAPQWIKSQLTKEN